MARSFIQRAEHGADGAPELIPRVVRELLAGALLDERLERGDELLQVVGGELGVLDVARDGARA